MDIEQKIEDFYKRKERVEVEWIDGYEDYSSYGLRTDGKKARFYIGKSTGVKPIYLQIDNRRSHGGPALLISGIKSIKGLGIYK